MARVFLTLPQGSHSPAFVASFQADRIARPTTFHHTSAQRVVFVTDTEDPRVAKLLEAGAKRHEDFQFGIVPRWQEQEDSAPEAPLALDLTTQAHKSLDDVLEHIQAPQAWQVSRGNGVTIAVIDSGICDNLLEFPTSKRSTLDVQNEFAGQHWLDVEGHGSMVAVIAAATRANGGRFDGVAPDATILSVRTNFKASDIYSIYRQLVHAKRSGQIAGPLVIVNSYAAEVCVAPHGLPSDHPSFDIVAEAVSLGIPVIFAAGDNHRLRCLNDPTSCGPNTIWGLNAHRDVLTVGTVNQNNSNRDPNTLHVDSSRGPGQPEWTQGANKPDCVAPTYGEVTWGCSTKSKPWWGTSGAAPQVAGLAALILARNPMRAPSEVYGIIRETCLHLDAPATCVGPGLIDCEAAIALA